MLTVLLGVLILAVVCAQDNNNYYALNIIHYNDFHARFEETSWTGGICDRDGEDPCVAGYARLVTKAKEILKREPNSILLNAGDTFQGTIWYNILRWNVTQDFMNMLPHDAHVLGNHEFDNGIEGVIPYLQHLNSSVVVSNMVDDEEPDIQGLYNKSVVIARGGRQIGIIGVIIATTDQLASTGKLKFTDEVEAVRLEAEKLNSQGVNIIVVLSHCGIDIDREIALRGGPYIDIIVGGHSHTLLYNGDPPPGFRPQGPYPYVVEQESRKVLIVQAAAHTLYLGEIKLYFDESGHFVDWNQTQSRPHYIGNEIEQDPAVVEKINQYLPLIEDLANTRVGESMVHLDSSCNCKECNLGTFICEAFLHSVLDRAEGDNWHYAHFCVINQGGIREAISPGNVTFAELLQSTPFENRVEIFELRGDHIMEMLEYSVSNVPFPGARMLQVSGLRANFDGSKPMGSRVVSASVRCIECPVPHYEPLDLGKNYRVVSQSFIGSGGDGFSMISNNRQNVEDSGKIDYEVLIDYFEKYSPIFVDVDGRMEITDPCSN